MTYDQHVALFSAPREGAGAPGDLAYEAQRDYVVAALRRAVAGMQYTIDSNPKGAH